MKRVLSKSEQKKFAKEIDDWVEFMRNLRKGDMIEMDGKVLLVTERPTCPNWVETPMGRLSVIPIGLKRITK